MVGNDDARHSGTSQHSDVEHRDIERDVVVIGGGAAGLTAAITLARFDRSVEVIDAERPRNAPAEGVHNLLGHDGIPPGRLLASGREELRRFGGRITVDTAVGATVADGLFTVAPASGGRRVARRLIVTSGVRDVLPDVPGLAARWGRDVLHRPYRHGFEVRHQAIGVLATNPAAAAHQAQLFRELTEHVVVLAHTAAPLTAEHLEQLEALDVRVVEGEVTSIEIDDSDRLSGVRLADGRVIACRALVVAPQTDVSNDVLDALGASRSDDHGAPGGYTHDESGATPATGVWVAGNVADPFDPVVLASAAGLEAAAAVNADLMTEHVHAAVAAHRAASTGTRPGHPIARPARTVTP